MLSPNRNSTPKDFQCLNPPRRVEVEHHHNPQPSRGTIVKKNACSSPHELPSNEGNSTPPLIRQSTTTLPQKSVLQSIRKRPSRGSAIAVTDKYDTGDSHLWKPTYPPHRIPPPRSSRWRSKVTHPNILFDRVVSSHGGPSCGEQYATREDEDPEQEPCATPLDWDHDPVLRTITGEDRQAYRQCKLEEYLRDVCAWQKERDPPERFEHYLIRCYAYANWELNSNKAKHLLGYVDDLSALDVWVVRLCRGAVLKLARNGIAYTDRDGEVFLRLLREECAALHSERGSGLRRHLDETERQLSACNEQERKYNKLLLRSQRCNCMGVMQHLKRRDWRSGFTR